MNYTHIYMDVDIEHYWWIDYWPGLLSEPIRIEIFIGICVFVFVFVIESEKVTKVIYLM